MGSEWPSCYYHAELNLFLVIYVDDFKLSGPATNLEPGWDLIRKGLHIDKPRDIHGQTYLGCVQERSAIDLPGGGTATVDTKNMEDFMKSCVQLYRDLAPGATLRQVATPFLAEDQRDSPARGPAGAGPVEECPWCCHSFSPNPYPSVSALEKHRKNMILLARAPTASVRHPRGPVALAPPGTKGPRWRLIGGGWRPSLPRY